MALWFTSTDLPANALTGTDAERVAPPRRLFGPSAGRSRLERALMLVMCFAGLWFLLGQVFRSRFGVVPGDLGDSRFNAIILEHGFQFLSGDAWHRPFWSPRWAFFPHENVLAYSDNLIGTLPLYALFRALRLRALTAFNGWLIAICLANFFATYLMLRAMTFSRIAAAIVGFLFAFAMPRGQQLNHLQLFPHFFTPLCFLCLIRLRSLRPWAVWGAFGCAVLQLYAAVYLGWFLAFALAIAATLGLFTCIFSKEFRQALLHGFRRLWLHILAALLVSALALLPMALHYSRAQSEVGERHVEEIGNLLPRAGSYVLPADYTLLYRPLLKLKDALPMAHEQVLFAGFVALGCMLLLLVVLGTRGPGPARAKPEPPDAALATNWWLFAFAGIWLITALVTFWLDGSLWMHVYRFIPGGGAIRAVSRMVLFQLLPLGVAVAWVTDWLEKRVGWGAAVAIAALVVLENSGSANYAFSVNDHVARVNRVHAELATKQCATFFISGDEEPYKLHLDAMWASLAAKIPTLNGYSGNAPPKWKMVDLQDVRMPPLRRWLRRHKTSREHLCLFRR